MHKLATVLMVPLLCSCGSGYVEPHLEYHAVVDGDHFEAFKEIQESIRRTASRREMVVEEVPFPYTGDENFALAVSPNEAAAHEGRVVLWVNWPLYPPRQIGFLWDLGTHAIGVLQVASR